MAGEGSESFRGQAPGTVSGKRGCAHRTKRCTSRNRGLRVLAALIKHRYLYSIDPNGSGLLSRVLALPPALNDYISSHTALETRQIGIVEGSGIAMEPEARKAYYLGRGGGRLISGTIYWAGITDSVGTTTFLQRGDEVRGNHDSFGPRRRSFHSCSE